MSVNTNDPISMNHKSEIECGKGPAVSSTRSFRVLKNELKHVIITRANVSWDFVEIHRNSTTQALSLLLSATPRAKDL